MIDLSVDLIMANNILWQSELEKFTSAGTILTNFSEAYALLTALPFNGQIGYAFRNKDFIFKNIYLTSCKQHNKVGSFVWRKWICKILPWYTLFYRET